MKRITQAASRLLSGVLTRATFGSRQKRRLRSTPARRPPTNHSVRRINALAKKFALSPRYLEIGLQQGKTFQDVQAATRSGVEPYPQFSLKRLPKNSEVFVGTSDLFFESCKSKFDLIFIDGLHEATQTYRDLINALCVLDTGGVIVLDDVMPIDEPSSLPSLHDSEAQKRAQGVSHPFWYGDVYKVLGVILDLHPELNMVLIGDTPEHVQALIWRRGTETVAIARPEAEALMAEWTYSDFFPLSRFLESVEILPEEQAIEQVPVNQDRNGG